MVDAHRALPGGSRAHEPAPDPRHRRGDDGGQGRAVRRAAAGRCGSARRIVGVRHPQPGWVEKDPLEILGAIVDVVAELLADAPGEVVACGLDHEGESVLAWDAETGEPLTPVVVWQDKRARGGPRRAAATTRPRSAAAAGCRSTRTSRRASSPGCCATTPRSPRRASAARCGWAPSTRSSATASARASSTDASTASRTQLHALGTPGWDPWLLERFGVPADVLPSVGDSVGALGDAASRALAGRAAADRARLRPAGGARRLGLRRPRRRQGDVRHRRLRARARRRRRSRRGRRACCRRSRGGSAGATPIALDGGVFAAGAMLEWLCEQLAHRADAGGARRSSRGRSRTRAAPACCPRSPGSARRGGSPARAR